MISRNLHQFDNVKLAQISVECFSKVNCKLIVTWWGTWTSLDLNMNFVLIEIGKCLFSQSTCRFFKITPNHKKFRTMFQRNLNINFSKRSFSLKYSKGSFDFHFFDVLWPRTGKNIEFFKNSENENVRMVKCQCYCDDYAEPAVLLQLITVYLSYYST